MFNVFFKKVIIPFNLLYNNNTDNICIKIVDLRQTVTLLKKINPKKNNMII